MAQVASEKSSMIDSDEWKDLLISKVIDESKINLMQIKSQFPNKAIGLLALYELI